MIDTSRMRIPPFAHQVVGVETILANPYFFLGDEMGAGKTKQAIDAAQYLYVNDVIDRVIVVAPASVRSVWYNEELGELAKHLWDDVSATVAEFHAKVREWRRGPTTKRAAMQWIITNYDFIRQRARYMQLVPYCTHRTLLILDESSAVKNYRAERTLACKYLRNKCGRVLLLNGTPIANSPADLYSQFSLMDPRILDCKTFFHFRARYAILGGFKQRQIVGWVNIEDLQNRIKPFILRRLKKDCLDLPEKMPPVALTVPLTEKTWKIYKEMRDQFVAWLSEASVSVSSQAVTKAMRLSQITSGFLGGMMEAEADGDTPVLETDVRPSFIEEEEPLLWDDAPRGVITGRKLPAQEIGREKLDFLLQWMSDRMESDPDLKLLIWCRFRPELTRIVSAIETKFGLMIAVAGLHGGQKKIEREYALNLLHPEKAPSGPAVVVGTKGTGSLGLNMTASHTVINMSDDYSLFKRKQSDDRVHRPGQVHDVSYFDIIATGPNGQRTIDHSIAKVQRDKDDVATWTQAAWISEIARE